MRSVDLRQWCVCPRRMCCSHLGSLTHEDHDYDEDYNQKDCDGLRKWKMWIQNILVFGNGQMKLFLPMFLKVLTHLCAHFLRNSTFAEKLRSRVWFSWLALASTENCENCKVVRSEEQSPERTLEAPLSLIQHSVIKQEAPNWSFVQIARMHNEIITTEAMTMLWPWIPREFKVFQCRCLWYLAKPSSEMWDLKKLTEKQLLRKLACHIDLRWQLSSVGATRLMDSELG